MLRIALLGYGRMGREIEALTCERGHQVAATFDIDSKLQPDSQTENIDVFIDFTEPRAVLDNVRAVAQLRLPMVIGTTGWSEHLPEVEAICQAAGIGILYASNFSIGMNLFFRMASQAATLFNAFEQYDVFLHEAHHRGKLDSPSGTALSLAQIVLDKVERKRDLLCSNLEGKIAPEQLHVTSTRAGHAPGAHLVAFDSSADTIELRHTARNRSGFAAGALLAAEWLVGRQGCFTMKDLIDDQLSAG